MTLLVIFHYKKTQQEVIIRRWAGARCQLTQQVDIIQQ